jgi:hypothetical protein
VTRTNSVWVPPSARTFSCLCETCLEVARGDGCSLVDAVRSASVRGQLLRETDVGFVHCAAGHVVVVRRMQTPAQLGRVDARQMQIV